METHNVITAQNSKPRMLNKGITQSINETEKKKITQNQYEMVLYIIMMYHQFSIENSTTIE